MNDGFKEFFNQLLKNLEIARGFNKKIVFSISTTGKVEDRDYLTPVRPCDDFVLLGCVIFSSSKLEAIADILSDTDVDYIFVDAEKKIPITFLPNLQGSSEEAFDTCNFSKLMKLLLPKREIFEYKPNDLTVDAVWRFLESKYTSLSGLRICIVGLGNIGTKLALKLVECGADVHVSGRDYLKTLQIASTLNTVKPIGTIASLSCYRDPLSAAFGADAILGCTNGIPVIDESVTAVLCRGASVIDVGKNNLTPEGVRAARERGCEIYRADVSHRFQSFVAETLLYELMKERFGVDRVADIGLVSGGYLGDRGDVVVDNVKEPKILYGISDGSGGFKVQIDERDAFSIQFLKEKFNAISLVIE